MKGDELEALAARAFAGLGIDAADAAIAARILVLADLFGHHTHGVSRIESYGERLRLGGINARPAIRIEKPAAATALIDGDNGLGPVVGMRALQTAMEMARTHGIGMALARHSNHFGAIGPYCFLAAQQGFASIIGSNSTATIAPTGGREAKVGNSPLGIGVPHPGGPPVILDMAMSVVARAKIRDALKRGESIPAAWATDKQGAATSDPKAALDGFLLPIGGYKGYGLALIVDLFAGLLSGAAYLTHVKSWQDEPEAPQDLGHFFILIDTARLGGGDWLASRMADFAQILHDTPAADAAHPVLLPGEREMQRYERALREGVAIDSAVLENLRALACCGQNR